MSKEITIKVPNLGGSKGAVIEILVHPNDKIQKDTSLVTLESEKASMEIPATEAGIVKEILVKIGDQIGEGDALLTLITSKEEKLEDESSLKEFKSDNLSPHPSPLPKGERGLDEATALPEEKRRQAEANTLLEDERRIAEVLPPKETRELAETDFLGQEVYAGPAVRRMARDLGIELANIKGGGPKGRITIEDLKNYLKSSSQQQLPALPVIDFSQFGAIEVKPLNKIKKFTGVNVTRAWQSIPHVTQFDMADITDLENFRKEEINKIKPQDYKLTILSFVTKAVCKALSVFPQFNSSLDGDLLVLKKYYNIGFAAETPNGLLVPVIKNCDKLSIVDLAKEMSTLSKKAREKGLMPTEMSGGCFTISSLGGIGGTAFTPIINSPEVAILGLSRTSIQPVYDGSSWQPRLFLPLSLSYDHRVIDGAEAARFTRYIADLLFDLRRILL